MNKNKKISLIEGFLFINGDAGCELNDICYLCDVTNDEGLELILILKEKYRKDELCGLDIQTFAKTNFRMMTKKEDSEFYKKIANLKVETKLSSASIETLSIIAYKGPISRPEIEEIRGVNCDNVIYKLKLRNLIEEAGKSDKPGRPMNYSVTKDFLKYFNINSLDDLPQIDWKDSEGKNIFD